MSDFQLLTRKNGYGSKMHIRLSQVDVSSTWEMVPLHCHEYQGSNYQLIYFYQSPCDWKARYWIQNSGCLSLKSMNSSL